MRSCSKTLVFAQVATLVVLTVVLSGCKSKDTNYTCHGDGHVDCKGESGICAEVKKQCQTKLKQIGEPLYTDPKFKAFTPAERHRREGVDLAKGQVLAKSNKAAKDVKVSFSKAAVNNVKGKGGGGIMKYVLPAVGGVLLLGGLGGLVYFLTHGSDKVEPHMSSPRISSPVLAQSGCDWTPLTSEDGNTFYYNAKTGESSWTLPAVQNGDAQGRASSPRGSPMSPTMGSDDWQSIVDPVSGNSYFYNVKTGQSSWTKPN